MKFPRNGSLYSKTNLKKEGSTVIGQRSSSTPKCGERVFDETLDRWRVAMYAVAQQTDPLSVLKALFEARNAHDAKAAAAFFAEDATIMNTNGRKTSGRENIRKIMEGDNTGNAQLVLESPKMMGDKITFTDLTTRDVFRKLEVAPCKSSGKQLCGTAR